MPDPSELEAAECLSAAKEPSNNLITASKVFLEAAFVFKLEGNPNEANKYYKISLDLTFKAAELWEENVKCLHSCLMILIDFPKELFKEFYSNEAVNKMIQKLSNIKNSHVDAILGKYYLIHEKDYEKAKEYLSRGMSGGHFGSAIQLVKVECLLQPVHKYSFVQSLNLIYETFTTAKRRLIILSHIILYFYYIEDNPKEMMHYLKLYINHDIDDTLKKRQLITHCYPLFRVVGDFKPKQFLSNLSSKIEEYKHSNIWGDADEKKTVLKTVDKFDRMSRVQIYRNKDKPSQQNENNNMKMKYQENNYWRGRGRKKQNNWRVSYRESSECINKSIDNQHDDNEKKHDYKKNSSPSSSCLN